MRLNAIGCWKVKKIQCYLSFLIWLTVTSIGLFWLMGRDDGGKSRITNKALNEPRERSQQVIYKPAGESWIINRICNKVHLIKAEEEYLESPEYTLEGLVILLRHGDRGPLNHIGRRNVSHLNCETEKTADFTQFTQFATDTLLKLPGYSQFIGPVHSFPKVPVSPFCSLGQLSQLGAAQLLQLGKVIRAKYEPAFFNFTPFNNHDNIVRVHAFSTRYRRTFQSLFAFLYGFVGPKQFIQSTTIHESQSIVFCFKHCSCKGADQLKKIAGSKKPKLSSSEKDRITNLINDINTVLGTEKSKKTGNSLLDSILAYPCHNIQLPCRDLKKERTKGENLIQSKNLVFSTNGTKSNSRCISTESVEELIGFINRENEDLKTVEENRKFHLLSSYGLMKEILNFGLRMSSFTSQFRDATNGRKQQTLQSIQGLPNGGIRDFGEATRPTGPGKIVVFSGHDVTLQSVLVSLGIVSGHHPDLHLPPFASRIIFEFYRRHGTDLSFPKNLYFRIVYNGISLTHLINFCKDSDETISANDATKSLCSVENLVKFIHDNYFNSFANATNFREACKSFG